MRSWIAVCAIVAAISYDAGATDVRSPHPALTTETRECFQWFSTLEIPDLKNAEWAELPGWTRAGDHDSVMAYGGFILRETQSEFLLLTHSLSRQICKKSTPGESTERLGVFERRPFFDVAHALLADLRQRQGYFGGHFESFWAEYSQVFFIAYACSRKGDDTLAQQLLDAAARLRNPYEGPEEKDWPSSMKKRLEYIFGCMATDDAVSRIVEPGPGGDERPLVNRITPWNELAAEFRRIIRLYPASGCNKEAHEMAAMLEKMAAEDAHHQSLSPAKLEKLPIDKRVAELIFQLRNLHCNSGEDPFKPSPPLDNPAYQLAAIGDPAVPLLISTIGNQRLTGSGFGTVGYFAETILDNIAGRDFRNSIEAKIYVSRDDQEDAIRKAVRDWQRELHAKGEKQTLIDYISSGKANPHLSVIRLQKVSPDAVRDALLNGAIKVKDNGLAQVFIDELENFKSDPFANMIRQRLDNALRMGFDSMADIVNSDGTLDIPAIEKTAGDKK